MLFNWKTAIYFSRKATSIHDLNLKSKAFNNTFIFFWSGFFFFCYNGFVLRSRYMVSNGIPETVKTKVSAAAPLLL